jgi:hypothetical protein
MKPISAIVVPVSPEDLGGPSITVASDLAEILAEKDGVVLIEFTTPIKETSWFDSFDLLYCQRQHHEDLIKVIRKATEAERRAYRVPLFIQSDDVPECCGAPMFFVGQLDDDSICMERPEGAKLWWHDKASFYVFTCSKCLGVKAVGQQM